MKGGMEDAAGECAGKFADKKTVIDRYNKYGNIFSVLFIATILSIIPLIIWDNVYMLAAAAVLYVVTFWFAIKVERIKKDNDVHTYKEIVAFTEGKRLDEMERNQELGKRPYQSFVLALGSALIVLVIGIITIWLTG